MLIKFIIKRKNAKKKKKKKKRRKEKITKKYFRLFNIAHLFLTKKASMTLSVTSYNFLRYFSSDAFINTEQIVK